MCKGAGSEWNDAPDPVQELVQAVRRDIEALNARQEGNDAVNDLMRLTLNRICGDMELSADSMENLRQVAITQYAELVNVRGEIAKLSDRIDSLFDRITAESARQSRYDTALHNYIEQVDTRVEEMERRGMIARLRRAFKAFRK